MATTLRQIVEFLSTLETACFAISLSFHENRAYIQTLLQA